MKIADLLEARKNRHPKPSYIVLWTPDQVKYSVGNSRLKVSFPEIKRDIRDAGLRGPSLRKVVRAVQNKILDMGGELMDMHGEELRKFDVHTRHESVFLVKGISIPSVKEIIKAEYDKELKSQEHALEQAWRDAQKRDEDFFKGLLDEATKTPRKLTPEECERLGRIYDDLERFGLTDRLPSKPSSQAYMNQLLIKLSAGDIYVNPFFGADDDFKIKIRFNPDLRHAKMSIGDLYDGDPATYKKLKMRAKLADNQISIIEVLEEAVKVCKKEDANKFVAWVYGEDEVNDFEEQEADKKIEELVRLHGNGVFQIEAVWKS